jgi:hypothetical protein
LHFVHSFWLYLLSICAAGFPYFRFAGEFTAMLLAQDGECNFKGILFERVLLTSLRGRFREPGSSGMLASAFCVTENRLGIGHGLGDFLDRNRYIWRVRPPFQVPGKRCT